jgi:hypothetical protein
MFREVKPRGWVTDNTDESTSMIVVLHSQILAIFKAAVHIVSAVVIVWYLYRLANGQTSLL